MEWLERRVVREFIKFGLVGSLSFVVDAGLYLVLTRKAGVFYLYAKLISFCVAAANSYLLNRRWTFRSRDPNRVRQAAQFFAVASVGASLNAGIMYLLHGVAHLHDLMALVLTTGVVMFWNFLANRAWTFRTCLVEAE